MLLLTILAFIVAYYFHKYSFWRYRNVKHPTPIPFFGNFGDFILQKKCLGDVTNDLCRKFPDEPIVGAYYVTEPVLFIKDPELIKLVTTKDFYYFNGREVSEHTHKECITKNLFFTYGDHWRVLRQNLTPIYTSAKIKGMFHLIDKCNKELEKMLDVETTLSDVLEVKDLMGRFTMDVICLCAFGMESKAMGEEIQNNPFRLITNKVFDTSRTAFAKIALRSTWPSLFYALGLNMFSKDIYKFFSSLLLGVFKERNYSPSERKDFVDLVLTVFNKEYIVGDTIKNLKTKGDQKISIKVDDELLIAQCVVFYAGGFQTTSTTSSFALFELAKNPEIQDRVFEEIDAYLSTRGGLQYDCVTELPSLMQCVDETLRLYPVLPFLTRQVYENYKLPNGLCLERGMHIYLPVIHIHQDPKYFPEPEKFKPERFSREERHNIPPYTYLPFGEGPRTCIGMRFGKLQVITGLVTVLKKYRVELAEGMPRNAEFHPTSRTLQNRRGIRLKLIKRERWQNNMYGNSS